MSEEKKTYSQALIYAVAIVIRHLASFVMLPIYTRFLTPQDYGIAELLSMGVEVVGMLFGVVSGQALFRYYFESDKEEYKKDVVATTTYLNIFLNAMGFIFIWMTSAYWAEFLFEGTGVLNQQRLVILYGASIVFQVMSSMPMNYIRAQQKPKLYVFFSVLRLTLAIIANLYFIVYLELHIEGVVYAVFTFTLIDGSILTAYMIGKIGFRFSQDIAKKVLNFSWPLMISSLILFVATFSDRIFLKIYIDAAEVGIYSLAYKFGFLLTAMAWTPFEQAWDARRYEIVKRPDATAVFQSIFRQTQLFVIFVALGLAIFSKDILRLMSDPAFHRAYELVWIILLSYVIKIWSNFCSFGLFYCHKTKYNAYSEFIGASVSFSLYLLLIPVLSSWGAALATLVALSIRFLLINYWATKFYNMHLQWGFIAKVMVLSALTFLASSAVGLPLVMSIFFNAGLILVFLAAIFLLPILPAEDKAVFIALFRHPVVFIKNKVKP